MGTVFFLTGITVNAQTDTIEAGLNKTISILFPQMIKAVDRGSRDLLVQKLQDAEHLLQVKAGRENFPETNMTVLTVDGKLYSFIVRYTADPVRLCWKIDSGLSVFDKIRNQPATISGIWDNRFEMHLRLQGLYIEQDILYFQIELENTSSIGYDIEMLRLYTRDKRQGKRTASQEIQMQPLYTHGNTHAVPAQSLQTLVIALPSFTIPDKKNCYISLNEKNGGRRLRIRIRNKDIVRAIDLKSI